MITCRNVYQASLFQDDIKIITPGISLNSKTDGINQNYNSIEDKLYTDIYVIGRYITKSLDPLKNLENILDKINNLN